MAAGRCCAYAEVDDPNDPQRLIGIDSPTGKLQRSTDGGASWQPATTVAGALAQFVYAFDGAGRLGPPGDRCRLPLERSRRDLLGRL